MNNGSAVKQLLAQILMDGGVASKKTHSEDFLAGISRIEVPQKFLKMSALESGRSCTTCSSKECQARNVEWSITDAGKEFIKS